MSNQRQTPEPQRLSTTHSAKSLDGNERQNIIARSIQKILAFFRRQNPGGLGRNTHFIDRIEGIHHRVRAFDCEAEKGRDGNVKVVKALGRLSQAMEPVLRIMDRERTNQHRPEPFLKDAKSVSQIRYVPVASPLQALDLEMFIDGSLDRTGLAHGLVVRNVESDGILERSAVRLQ